MGTNRGQYRVYLRVRYIISTVGNLIDRFLLSHPNGWSGPQQAKLRLAATKAKLIPSTSDGKARIHFVSEGEASFHWCLNSGLADSVLKVSMLVALSFSIPDVSLFRKEETF
jgi:hypothetical protein